MRRRQILAIAMFAVLLLLAITAVVVLPRRHRVDRNCEEVQIGMTGTQVEELLGKPADDKKLGQAGALMGWLSLFQQGVPVEDWKVWIGDEFAVFVGFNPQGRVFQTFNVRVRSGWGGPLHFLRNLIGQ